MEYIIVFLPLVGAILSGFFGKFIGHRISEILTSLFVSISAILSIIVFYDVITFDYGEILVSAETALSNSEELQVSLENEILLYIIHGMLHLGGYLDGSRSEFKEMKSLQEMILDSCLKVS